MILTLKCVRGVKIGDSLIRDDDGNLQSVYPDSFYPTGTDAYWMLKRIGNWWKIVKVMGCI